MVNSFLGPHPGPLPATAPQSGDPARQFDLAAQHETPHNRAKLAGSWMNGGETGAGDDRGVPRPGTRGKRGQAPRRHVTETPIYDQSPAMEMT